MSKYQQLDAWNSSMQLVTDIYELTKQYPKEELYGLTSQTRRAAISIPSNIAEGMGRQYKKETAQFLNVSRGSLYELETLLNIAVRVNIIDNEQFNKIIAELIKCLQLVNGLIRYVERSKLK